MSKNSIEFSLSIAEQRDSWLNSGHQTLDADTLVLLLIPIPPSCVVVPKSTIANILNPSERITINLNTEHTKARPDDNAPNIQCGCPTSKSSHCTSSMNNLSPPLEYDYAERVATQNNMNIEANTSLPLVTPLYNFILPPSLTPHAFYEKAPNSAAISDTNMPLEPSPPMAIPYSANILANPNL